MKSPRLTNDKSSTYVFIHTVLMFGFAGGLAKVYYENRVSYTPDFSCENLALFKRLGLNWG